ncbi:amidohydrolase family protein [Mycolicibacterium thermoresistibile]
MTTSVKAQPSLDKLDELGPILDIDSHEMIPLHMWPEAFGDAAVKFTELATNTAMVDNLGENSMRRDDLGADDDAIDPATVWDIKGPAAPSAIKMSRRVEVLDAMGVDRQLVYPNFALIGVMLACNPEAHKWFGYDPTNVDRVQLGRDVIAGHNDWVLRTIREVDANRVRPVGLILTESLDQMMADTQRLIDGGTRALMIPGGEPPAGMSPADTRLDPWWALVAEADMAVTLHIGTEFPFLASSRWASRVPQFKRADFASLEFPVEPYFGATMNFTHENFITVLVLGGVFERHPTLRFGCLEITAQWIGPLADRLDLWETQFHKRFTDVLTMKPSEYINRNIRVGPFPFEDVASYFNRYPHLSDVYSFSSDFPHVEGGKGSKQKFYENLAPLGEDVLRKFYVDNPDLLLPAQ